MAWVCNISLGLLLAGCVNQLVPIGSWSRPSELELGASPLSGLSVSIECGREDQNRRFVQNMGIKLCWQLEHYFEAQGAVIVKSDRSAARSQSGEFTVRYIEHGLIDYDNSWTGVLVTFLTLGLYPHVSWETIQAEVRVLNRQQVTLDSVLVTVQDVNVFGWGAIRFSANDSGPGSATDLGRRFFHFMSNELASQKVRQRWAEAHPGSRSNDQSEQRESP